jgi:hypothetical protein
MFFGAPFGAGFLRLRGATSTHFEAPPQPLLRKMDVSTNQKVGRSSRSGRTNKTEEIRIGSLGRFQSKILSRSDN